MRDVRQALAKGEVLLGPFSVSGSSVLVEMIGYAGFDFVIIDCEHAATSPFGSELQDLIRAAHAGDITPFVRVTRLDRGQILKALNLGAAGVIIPHVNTRQEAEDAVSAARYAPLGRRSCAPPVRAARHGFVDWPSHYRRSQQVPMVVPLIEETMGVDNCEEISRVEGLDMIFFGPFDLAVALGAAEDVYGPSVEPYRDRVYKLAKKRGLPIADLAWDLESAADLARGGAQFIAVSTDLTMFGNSARTLASQIVELKQSLGER